MRVDASPDAHTGIVNAMTIDVEDYFHVSVFDGVVPRIQWSSLESRVRANTERLLALFDEHRVKATFFVLGWVAERCPSLVSGIVAAGHELASHGYGHRLVYDLTPATFREDVRRSKQVLESIAGLPVYAYRAPSYSITPRSLWALDILIEEGYRCDASIFPIHHDRYGIPVSGRQAYRIHRSAGSLLEVPGSTVRVGPLNLPIAGGGYFRLLPYAWTHWGIERLNTSEHSAAVFYLHPWELDPGQPRLQTSALGRLRHYRNLHDTERRLRQLLTDFRFSTLTNMLAQKTVCAFPQTAAAALPYVW